MGDPDSKPAKPDPVAERKKQNPAHTDLTTFFFVEHETFELLGGPWGDSDKYKEKLDLGPRALDPDEFWPWASVALQKAQKSRALAGYVAKHNVRDRWVYAFSVEKGQDPVLRFELRLDAKGRVSFLGRDDFLAIHGDPKADDQDDAAYLKRPQWKNTGQAFFKQKIPIGKAGAPIKWHFFGMSFRLTKGGVDEIEADASLLQPDPGFNFFAKDKDASKVEGVKIWKVSRLVPVGDGVLVRVFDPMTVLSNLRKQLHLRLDEFIHYTTPMQGDGNAEIRRRRHLVAAIANHANLVCERSSNVDIRHKELKRGSDVWPKLRNSCFTDAERVILDAEKVTPSAYDAPTFFMEMERRLRDNLLRRQVKAGTALMLWLSSKPWGLVERQSLTSDVRANAFAHLPLRASSLALERLGELDGGRQYLSRMIVSCEQSPGNKAVPNQALLEEFVLRDKPQPKGALDTAKIAIKAGKAPFDLWSKLLTLVTTMNKGFLEKLKLKHQPALDPKILEMLNSLSDQKAVFSAAALVMARRIRSVYRVNIVQANLTAFDLPNGQRGVIFYLPNGASKAATKPHIFELRPGDGLKGEIAKLHKEVGLKDLPEPQGRLTFDHVKNVTSVIGLFFSVRDLYISGTDKGALDVTKSAFNVLKALYGLPWVSKRVTARITDVSLRRLSQELAGDEALHVAGLAAKRGVARIAFVVQIVTVGFAAHDVWSKSQTATKDQVVSSAVSLSCEVLLLISAGLVVASGGTMTPLAAVLAAAAAVISVAQFVYELFRPEEHVYAVRFCLFGVGFVESIGSPAGDARHWQACPKHDLRYFNPDFKGLDGLRTQIASFNNLMHGYGLQVSFTGAVAETGATVKIFPGAIPRQAYFEVKMTMEWWLSKAKGKVFTSPGDSWKAEYTYKFYPFADNVPPQPLQFSPQYYRDMRKHGVIDQRGGPFDVLVGRSANELMLYTYPKEAHIPKWTGVLNDIVGSTSVGAKIQKFYHAKYEVESKVVHKGGGKKDLEVTIELLPGSSDVAIQRMSVLAKMLQTGDGVVHDGGTVEFTADAASSVNGKGNREFTLIMPAPAPSPSGTFSFDTFQFKLKFIDADGHTPPKWGMQSEPMHPGQKMQVEEKTVSDPSKDTFHYRIDYDAQLIDDGTGPMLDFVVTKAFVRRKSEDPSKGKVTKDLFISGVVLQYVRNEGSGKPLEEGTLAKPLWTSMIRIGDSFNSHFRAHLNKKTYHSSPVLLFDRLTYRFSVETISDTGTKRWTGSNDDWTKRTVKWTYTSEEQAGRSFHTQLIKSAKCELRLVLDGDPDTRNFNPNDITLSSRRAYTVAEVSGSIGSIVWSPASHAGALGPPESKVVQSILACKVQ